MTRDPQHIPGRSISLRSLGSCGSRRDEPGKRTLTEGIAATESTCGEARPAPPWVGPASTLDAGPAARPTLASLFGRPVQHRGPDAAAGPDATAEIHAGAQRGIASPATPLPYAEAIQRSFGRHDISAVQAHIGHDATAAAGQLGAAAYATGAHVVLGRRADLFTVAHEAAHVVQQRGGVQLLDGLGTAGDRYEQHANDVATLVVQGRSAEHLLDEHAPPDPGAPCPVGATTLPIQRFPIADTDLDTDDDQLALKILPLSTVRLREIAKALRRDDRCAASSKAKAALNVLEATIRERIHGIDDGIDPMSGLDLTTELLPGILSYLSDQELHAMALTNHAWRDLGLQLLLERFSRAMRAFDFEAAAQLLRFGWLPVETIHDDDGNTPLHLAIQYGHKQLIDLLIAMHHPLDVLNGHGLSPGDMLEDLRSLGDDEIIGDHREGPSVEWSLAPPDAPAANHGTTPKRREPRASKGKQHGKQRKKQREKQDERQGGDLDLDRDEAEASEAAPILQFERLRATIATAYRDDLLPGQMIAFEGRSVPYTVGELLASTREYNLMAKKRQEPRSLLVQLTTVSGCCAGLCIQVGSLLDYMVDPEQAMAAKVFLYDWITQRIPRLAGRIALDGRAALSHLGPPTTQHFPERHHSIDPASAPGPRGDRWRNVPKELERDKDLGKLAQHKKGGATLKSTQEALSGLAAKRLGGRFKTISPAPRRNDERKDVEFYDTDGMPWDQKGPCSYAGDDPIPPIVVSLADQLGERFPAQNMQQNKDEQPYVGVLLDCSYLSARDYRRLWAALLVRFEEPELERIVEVNVDYSGLDGVREEASPTLGEALRVLMGLASDKSLGRGPCGPVFTISEVGLAKHITNIGEVRGDPDGAGAFKIFWNHDGHLPQLVTSLFMEYSVTGPLAQCEDGGKLRLVHDKRGEGRLYITATHYTPWVQAGRMAALRNPFFEIVRS
jgi:hypothetical protein